MPLKTQTKKYKVQILTPQGEIKKSTIIRGDFKVSFSAMG
jgi:hypothetical protein